MSAVIRSEITLSPGESDDRNASFEDDIAEGVAIGTATAAVERERGSGTLGVASVASEGRVVSYVAALSPDATAGSVFIVTITAVAGSPERTFKVSERVTCVA